MLIEVMTSSFASFSQVFSLTKNPFVIKLTFIPRSLACLIGSKMSFRMSGSPPLNPNQVAPKSYISSTTCNAPFVSNSSGAGCVGRSPPLKLQ